MKIPLSLPFAVPFFAPFALGFFDVFFAATGLRVVFLHGWVCEEVDGMSAPSMFSSTTCTADASVCEK